MRLLKALRNCFVMVVVTLILCYGLALISFLLRSPDTPWNRSNQQACLDTVPASSAAAIDLSGSISLKTIKTITIPHEGLWVSQIAFSPDGRWLAINSPGVIDIWDTQAWVVVQSLEHAEYPQAYTETLAFSPDGQFLALGNGDVTLWETNTWQQLSTLKFTYGINDIAFDSQSKQLFLAGERPEGIVAWDLTTYESRVAYSAGSGLGLGGIVRTVDVIGAGTCLLFSMTPAGSSGGDGVYLFDTRSQTLAYTSSGSGSVPFVDFREADRTFFYSYWIRDGSAIGRVDLAAQKERTLSQNGEMFAISPTLPLLVSGFNDREFYDKDTGSYRLDVWSLKTFGTPLLVSALENPGRLLDLAFSSDGKTFATLSQSEDEDRLLEIRSIVGIP